jgi:riboflavin synthase
MFTGIIEEVGTVQGIDPLPAGLRLRIGCRTVLEDSVPGSSIAVSGVCLTAAALEPAYFTADVSPETLQRSTLGALRPGSRVNLERPLSPSGRMGGHIVQGHVDGKGELVALRLLGNQNWWLTIRVPPEVERYSVFKGSIAIDGISLTIAALEGDQLSATIVPHTYQHTSLQYLRPGSQVNLECDILAKYVEKFLSAGKSERPERLTEAKLRDLGY